MIELHNAKYRMELGGVDVWKLTGIVFNHHSLSDGSKAWLSVPIFFDEETDILKTASGAMYRIYSYESNRDEVIQQIEKDILNGGYERK